ncbi:MAG: hypothetical protein RL033_6314 [Pseudomonadota bacterium]|jgi:hypothetical protein
MIWLRTLVRHLRARWAALLVAAAFLTVLFFHSTGQGLKFRLPFAFLGDEPHYLVTLNSVLWDGDVELGNNYARAWMGHVDSGLHRAGSMLDHHTYLPSFGGGVHQQDALFGAFDDEKDLDAWGRPRSRALRLPKSGVLLDEYSWHPSYPLYLLAPVMSLLPRTAVEPVMILLISALSFLAALRFRELCTTLVPSALYADLAMLAVFVGTPALFYSRAFFPEAFFVSLTVLACHSCLVRGNWLVPGLLMMLAASLKPPAALLAVPILVITASRDWRKAIGIFALVCLGVGFSFFELRVLKGVLQQGTLVDADRLMDRSALAYMPYANLFHERYGLFRYAPILVVSLIGWLPLIRRFPRESSALLLGVVLNYTFLCVLPFYGSAYAGRYQVPFIPLLGVGFVGIWFYRQWLRRSFLSIFSVVFLWSAYLNVKGALWWN